MENKKRIYFNPFSQTNFVLPKNDLSIPEKYFLYKNSQKTPVPPQPQYKKLFDIDYIIEKYNEGETFARIGPSGRNYRMNLIEFNGKKFYIELKPKTETAMTEYNQAFGLSPNANIKPNGDIKHTSINSFYFSNEKCISPKYMYFENENIWFTFLWPSGITYIIDYINFIKDNFDFNVYEFVENPNNIFDFDKTEAVIIDENYCYIEMPSTFKKLININKMYGSTFMKDTQISFCFSDTTNYNVENEIIKDGILTDLNQINFSNSNNVYLIVKNTAQVSADNFDYLKSIFKIEVT